MSESETQTTYPEERITDPEAQMTDPQTSQVSSTYRTTTTSTNTRRCKKTNENVTKSTNNRYEFLADSEVFTRTVTTFSAFQTFQMQGQIQQKHLVTMNTVHK